MSAQVIYDNFRAAGMTHAGACGVLGNLMAESSMIANIAQRGMTGLTDEQYRDKFDLYPDSCIRDGVGYGLAQWTFWSRKKALWEFARKRGTSIGNEETQMLFIVCELQTEFPTLWTFLCQTDDLYAATEKVCREYERPAVNNVDRRFEFAQVFDKDLGGSVIESTAPGDKFYPPDLSVLILQSVLVGNGYNTEITGYKNAHFLKTLRQFVTDIGG